VKEKREKPKRDGRLEWEEGWALYRLGPLLFLHTRPKKNRKKGKRSTHYNCPKKKNILRSHTHTPKKKKRKGNQVVGRRKKLNHCPEFVCVLFFFVFNFCDIYN
jgi:hypothetical protein